MQMSLLNVLPGKDKEEKSSLEENVAQVFGLKKTHHNNNPPKKHPFQRSWPSWDF